MYSFSFRLVLVAHTERQAFFTKFVGIDCKMELKGDVLHINTQRQSQYQDIMRVLLAYPDFYSSFTMYKNLKEGF